LGEVLPNMPENTLFLTWNQAAQSYDNEQITVGGSWYDNSSANPSTNTLAPGEGFALNSPAAFTLIIRGCEPTCPPPCAPTNGLSLVGRLGIGTAAWTNLFSCPPPCGARMSIFANNDFANYDYVNGRWTPFEPVLAVGQPAFVSVQPNTNCLPCTNNLVVNGGFEVTSPAVPPNTADDTLSPTTGVPGWTTDAADTLEVWGNTVTGLPASEGANQMEINARSNDQTVWQVVTNLSTNCPATFCFKYTGRFGLQGNTYNNDFTVTLSSGNSVSGDLLSADLDPNPYSVSGWTNYCFSFHPLSSTITIGFRGHPHYTNGYATAGGAHIDNVSLTQCCTNPCITLSCVGDKLVQCGVNWIFDAPTNILDACCTNYSLTFTTVTNSSFCPSVFTRTWLVSDACGNSNSCSQTVTVVNTNLPVLTCASNKTVPCGTAWSFDAPTAFDACCTNLTITVIGTVTNGASGPCATNYTRTWQATDCCTNRATCSQTVTVVNTLSPIVNVICVTNVYFAGGSNHFTTPVPSSPSAGLLARLQAAGVTTFKQFDDCSVNSGFADTISNLPSCITSATLTMGLKPCGSGSDNDMVNLFFTGVPGSGSWSSYIGSGSGSPSLLGNTWDTSTYPNGQVITVDLRTLNLISDMNNNGFLDFYCEDDTGVD
jgi:hypothetical protein